LISLDPFSVFAYAEEVACLGFYDRVQIGRSGDGPALNGARKLNSTAAVLKFTMVGGKERRLLSQ
jgi:hypothetical protein